MQYGDQQAHAARQVLAGTFHGVLSTHSLELDGYPFGSVVPFVLDQDGLPLLLLSHLSQHTRNIDADARCGLTVIEEGAGDIQERGRLSAVGDVSAAGPAVDEERYFAYFPHARVYLEQLRFRFYRFHPVHFHWNGGFATARWFSVDRIVRRNPLAQETRQRIIEQMNHDHREVLQSLLADRIGTGPEEARTVGIDAEGIDLRLGDRLLRIALPRPIGSGADAHEILQELASNHPR